jgi:hypothetical protein
MCKITAAQIVADGAAVGSALNELAAASTADPAVAADLKAAGTAIVNATANWKEGTPLTDIESAEQAAIAVLNVIPLTSAFAPLVAIAFTALNLLIANSQTQSSITGNAVADAHTLLSKEKVTNADSPWHGKAKIDHNPFHSIRVNFENTWNRAAAPLKVGTVKV